MTPPSVLIVSYHFYPSNEIGARRPTALARYLAEKGVHVVVVSAFGGQKLEPGSQALPGITAIPVRRPPRRFTDAVIFLKRKVLASAGHRNTSRRDTGGSAPHPAGGTSRSTYVKGLYFRVVQFIDEYKGWGLHALRAAIKAGRRHSAALVLSSSPPLSMLLVGTLTARNLHIPHILDLRDPWADFLAHVHPERVIDQALARMIERWGLRSAAAVTTTSSRFSELLVRREPALGSKVFVVRNGYDGPFQHLSAETGGHLAILFAGELYLHRDPIPLLEALERLLSRADVDASRISVTFMGRKTEHTERVASHWLPNKKCAAVVRFVGPQASDAVFRASMAATTLLNLAQLQPLTIPAKTFEHLASGRENFLLCEDDSESAEIVRNIAGVIQVDPRDAAALDRALLDLYERHVTFGRLRAPTEASAANFSRSITNERFWNVMNSITSVLGKPANRTLEPS